MLIWLMTLILGEGSGEGAPTPNTGGSLSAAVSGPS